MIKVVIKTGYQLLVRDEGASEKLIIYVTDIDVHDLNYAIDSTKLKDDSGWKHSTQLEKVMEKMVKSYLDNKDCTDRITSHYYKEYYKKMYIQN